MTLGFTANGENIKSIVCFEAWTNIHKMYFRIKSPFLELDYTASEKCMYRHFAPLNG
jgi:hypothetical protein